MTGFHRPGEQARRGPLELVICPACKLVQMRHTYPASWLYTWYGYRSGINPMMVSALRDVVWGVDENARLEPGDTVVDIGSNDGTLLRMFHPSINRVGFEPAKNLAADAKEGLSLLVEDYFSAKHLKAWITEHGKVKVVTACAMFYDLDKPREFLENVRKVLRDDGVFVIQMNYLPAMLATNGFDNISAEHVTLYSLTSLRPLLYDAGFETWDVETNDVNGGSFRIWCRPAAYRDLTPDDTRWHHEGHTRVREMLGTELSQGITRLDTYHRWHTKITVARQAIRTTVLNAVEAGKAVYVYGASTRGLVILEYCGLNATHIQGAAERNPEKWGRTYGGTGIVCVPEDEARAKADYFLILPWHFLPEFIERERAFLERGGQFIVPLPLCRVMGREAME